MVRYVKTAKQYNKDKSIKGFIFQSQPNLDFQIFHMFKYQAVELNRLESAKDIYIIYSSGDMEFNPIHHDRIMIVLADMLSDVGATTTDKIVKFEFTLISNVVDVSDLSEIDKKFGDSISDEFLTALRYYFDGVKLVVKDEVAIWKSILDLSTECNAATTVETILSLIGKTKDSVKSLWLPDNAIKIPDGTFKDFSSLTELDLPSAVQYIGNYSFMHCSALKRAYIDDSVSYIGADAF